MSTCATIWEKGTEDVHRRFSLIEKEIRKESYVKYPALGQKINKEMPSVHADIFSNGNDMLDVHSSIDNNLINGNKSVTFAEKTNDTARNQFRIATGGSYDNINKSLTELTKTSSGTLAIALDEKVIDLIDKKTLQDPNIIVTLKKTDSMQFTVDFNAEDSSTKDAYRVLVNRTPSGTRTLEVHKNFVNILQAANKIEQEQNIKKESPDATIDKKNKEPSSSKNVNKQSDNGKLISDLMQEYDANRLLDIKVRGKNGSITEIKAPLTKTLSGNLAVDVHELSLLGNMSKNAKERAVVIKESIAGSYDLDISRNLKSPNAVIRKTPSGGVLVVLTNPVLKSMEPAKPKHKEKFYNLKIKNSDCDVSDPPAVLKTTPSHNYLIVIDKEFEKGYKKVICDAVEDNAECYINIIKTDSDNYLINFDDSDRCFKSNALLIKSPSGNIKIVKNSSTGNLKPRQPSVDSGLKNFSEILSMLPQSSKVSYPKESQVARISDAKSSSDSNLYKNVSILTPDHTDLFKEPLTAIKKSNSGQYAVVLGKESKKAFINNFKSYLQSNSKGLIPVKRTDSGEITIILNGDQKEKTHYGSLKITPSGNIYVMVDEEIVKGLEKDKCSVISGTADNSTIDTRSTHMIGKVKNPVNKAVTTSCNAKPDSCGCDPSKCVCRELQCNAKDWKQGVPEKEDGLRLFHPEICGIDWSKVKRNQDGSYKVCDPDKCTEKCCNNTTSKKETKKAKDNLTHIVIKPCACKSVFQRNPREEQCFYVVDAVCPYHKDRYDSVSNDLLEISGLCNKASNKECFKNAKRMKTKPRILSSDNTSNWDSLHFLPPQLPAFLSGFKYR